MIVFPFPPILAEHTKPARPRKRPVRLLASRVSHGARLAPSGA